jgi:hypothetical protein
MDRAQEWRMRATDTYAEAEHVEHDSPGSLVAVELYARAGTEAAIATAFAVGGDALVPARKRKP